MSQVISKANGLTKAGLHWFNNPYCEHTAYWNRFQDFGDLVMTRPDDRTVVDFLYVIADVDSFDFRSNAVWFDGLDESTTGTIVGYRQTQRVFSLFDFHHLRTPFNMSEDEVVEGQLATHQLRHV